MIALFLGVALVRPTLVLLPEPSSPDVVIEALVKLPKQNDAERLCIRAAWETLLDGSDEYSALTLRGYAQQAGKPVTALVLRFMFGCVVHPDSGHPVVWLKEIQPTLSDQA